jgi:DNA-binding protein Fis
MNTVLVVDLIKGVPCPWPRLESDTHIMSAGSARPLEDAFRIAQHDMVTWVAGLCGLDPLDAYQLVTQAVESPLANVCDTNYTSIAKMAKRYLALRRAPGLASLCRIGLGTPTGRREPPLCPSRLACGRCPRARVAQAPCNRSNWWPIMSRTEAPRPLPSESGDTPYMRRMADGSDNERRSQP